MYVDMAQHIQDTNFIALGISVCYVSALFIYNEFLKPRVARRLSFPLPVELAAVVTGTLLSYFLGLSGKIATLGAIPTGLPAPTPPPLELLPTLLIDSLLIAIIAFSVNMSMASIFARKDHYSVDANQELLASGFSNVLGSFFTCLPFAASLSRSLIQHVVGGRTQVASLVSCSALLLIKFLILDMSSVCFVDPSSLKGMETIYEDFKVKGIVLCLAECSAQVYERMVNCDFFWKFPDAQLFAAVHDAVLFALQASHPDGNDVGAAAKEA
ncbi:uncharacterized protein GBIM_08666 [Gryllus bimaculatus]|nr:uncharacterized protein GBIM_08666 [Gryllus bimaculatus]